METREKKNKEKKTKKRKLTNGKEGNASGTCEKRAPGINS